MRVFSVLCVLSAVLAALICPSVAQSTAQATALANYDDAMVLNYALTLERLDSTFWSCYLTSYNVSNQQYCAYMPAGYMQFGQQDFANAGYNATIWNAVNLIAAEELTHAALINITVMSMGYMPVQPCMYQYPNVTSVAAYLQQGLTFETVGTAAYAGALNGLTNPQLVQVAATIASVEARHAGYLSALLGMVPFSTTGFNPAYNSSYVAQLISPYYQSTSCLSMTALPGVRPFGVTGNMNVSAALFVGNSTSAYGVTYTAAERANDLMTLNYALILEDLEATFYNNASATFGYNAFNAAGYANGSAIAQYLGVITGNENTHVATLRYLITAYGGTPVQNCTYNFSALGFNAFASVQNYLQYASIIENVGVSAYDGAANTLTDTYLLQAAATIDMIEARHVAFINSVLYYSNASTSFPQALDTPLTPQQVFNIVTGMGIITSCNNQSIAFPTVVDPLPGSSLSNSTTLSSSSGMSYYASSSSSSGQYYNSAAPAAPAQWLVAAIAAASAVVAMLL